MTAYYLHMANHKKYKYMDLTPEQLKASKGKKAVTSGRATITPNIPQPFFLDNKKSSGDTQNKSASSPFTSVNKIFTPKPKTYSPSIQSLPKSNSFVKTTSTSKSPGLTQITRSASFASGSNSRSRILHSADGRSQVCPQGLHHVWGQGTSRAWAGHPTSWT